MTHQALSKAHFESLVTNAKQQEIYDSEFCYGGSFGVRLSQTGRKSFFVIYPLHGKRKRMTLGTYPVLSLNQARARAIEILALAQNGQDPAAEQKRYRSSESVAQVIKTYEADHLCKNYAAKTQVEYQRILRREILPLWADRKIQDIDAQEVRRLLSVIESTRGKAVLAARVNAVISSLFEFALKRGYIKQAPNSSNLVQRPRAMARSRILSIAELQQIWRSLDSQPCETQALLKLLLLTAQRPGRVLGMKWNEIRMDYWYPPVPGNNTSSPIALFLVPQVIEALKQIVPNTADNLPIFSSRKGKRLTTLSRIIQRVQAASQTSDWNALDLYRSARWRLRQLGVRPDVIEALQLRQTNRLGSEVSSYDYNTDIRSAMQLWAKTIIPSFTDSSKGKKVVSIFR